MLQHAARMLIAALFLTISPAFAAPLAELPEALASYRGQIVYVDFWASWCAPCAQSFPWLNSLKARYGDRLTVVGVNVDERHGDAERFLAQHPAQFTLVFDPKGALAERYQVAGMPSAVILGADGSVLHQHVGFREEEIGDYERAIAAALNARNPQGKQP